MQLLVFLCHHLEGQGNVREDEKEKETIRTSEITP